MRRRPSSGEYLERLWLLTLLRCVDFLQFSVKKQTLPFSVQPSTPSERVENVRERMWTLNIPRVTAQPEERPASVYEREYRSDGAAITYKDISELKLQQARENIIDL